MHADMKFLAGSWQGERAENIGSYSGVEDTVDVKK